jgi:hypothetical protein
LHRLEVDRQRRESSFGHTASNQRPAQVCGGSEQTRRPGR